MALGLVATVTFSPGPVQAATSTPVDATTSIATLISLAAKKYDIAPETLHDTLFCESSLDPLAEGDVSTSTEIATTSWGIAQIHLPAHPEISKAEALDPAFSIDYMAHQISLGNGPKLWTCYRNLYGDNSMFASTY